MKALLPYSIKFKVSVGFLISIIAFVSVQILSNKSIRELKNTQNQMLASASFTNTLETIETSIEALESKITSFVLTGNRSFLKGNEKNLKVATLSLQFINDQKLSAQQQQLVSRLDSLVNLEIHYSQQALIAYDSSNTAQALQLINSGISKQIVAEIILVSNQMQQLEESNLAKIVQSNDAYSSKIERLDYAASAFAVIVILFSVIVLYKDINKRIKIEKELRVANEKANQLAMIKDHFMANMSHEIRTPMNAIIGFANLLGRSKLDDKQTRHVKAIQSSGENLMNIINDILDFSKIEAGMLKLETIPFSIPELLHSLMVMFLPKANDKNLQLDFFSADKLPESVLGDPTRLTQILVNLISNAIKFTKEGSVTIKTEIADENNSKITIRFMVKDTGIGIPKEKHHEIFERFTQADADTSRKFGGSGLGLSIARKLIEAQGGNIVVESAQGVGSSFIFTISYKKNTENKNLTTVENVDFNLNSNNLSARILVAEDNELNRHLVKSLLVEWGFTFDVVENGKEVIEILKRNNYDLILMDIQMPLMNGYETSVYIRKEMNIAAPIIAMTAHALPGEKEKCISFGMTDYIAKPIREHSFYNLLVKYIAGSKANSKPIKELLPTKQETRITNLDYLYELSNGKPEFVHEMMNLFIREVPLELDNLQKAITQKDCKLIYAWSHKIKSTISFAGLDMQLKPMLEQLENWAENETSLNNMMGYFFEIRKICETAISELADFLLQEKQ